MVCMEALQEHSKQSGHSIIPSRWHILVCISIHFFFVVTGFELVGTKHHRIAYYAKWIPYVQLIDGATFVTADKVSSKM
ncbi:hypothetical protein BCR42DRAFT_402322 [Absidia repens]|uniref:Uncharacterized protein n=1 Tax=Absidia repens TaxID=90262 RepID=A0A1X2IXR8_9FUNG|nr:hypothetical protein BCR42DRAFT_402322 [Absidia repens]